MVMNGAFALHVEFRGVQLRVVCEVLSRLVSSQSVNHLLR